METYHKVCRTDEVIEGEGKTVKVDNKLVAVFRVGEEWFAIDDVCPHMGASLATGYVEDGIVTCPWHAWRFRLCDGAWADNPKVSTGSYAIRVTGDDVEVCIPNPKAQQGDNPT